jgi:ferredoxin-NADP reductase
MFAKKHFCRVIDKTWMTPEVMRVRFESEKKFTYEAGQFLSLVIPQDQGPPVKRLYSFATAPEEAGRQGYELCVKYIPGGIGSEYLGRLQAGDRFEILAPYGDFRFNTPAERAVCAIVTGTGIAPLIAILRSQRLRGTLPKEVLCIVGSRHEDQILYHGMLESMGIRAVHAISKPREGFTGFHGRVTDYLRQLPADWNWHQTDFYLCGSAAMTQEVSKILRGGHGVVASAIRQEVFSPGRPQAACPDKAPATRLFPFALPFFKPLG